MHHSFHTFWFKVKRFVYFKLSSFEEKHLQLAVEEGAKQVAKKSVEKADEVDQLVKDLYDAEYKDDDLRDRFTRDILKRAGELRQKTKSEREQEIIKEFEGKIIKESGANPGDPDVLYQAGVEKKFNLRIRKNWWNLLGTKVSQEELNTWIDEAKKAEEDIKSKKVELAMYEASKKAMASARAILKTVSSAVTSTGGAEINAAVKKYMTNRAKALEVGKDVSAQEKAFAKKKETLDIALAKVEEKRQKGRELFDQAFGPQLQVLLDHKGELTQTDFDAKLVELRGQVKEFGDGIGIAYMELFLNQKLGIKPEILEHGSAYETPQTAKEQAREKARIAQWWNKVFGVENAAESDIQKFIDTLRKANPSFLTHITEGTVPAHVDEVLAFLYRGRLGNQLALPTKRVAKLTPEKVAQSLELAGKIATDTDFQDHLQTFADNWKDYHVDDLSYAYPLIEEGMTIPKVTSGAKVAPAERPTDDVLKDIVESFDLSNVFTDDTTRDAVASAIYDRVLKPFPKYQHMIAAVSTQDKLKFFITSKFRGVDLSAKVTPIKADDVGKFVKVIDDILNNIELIDGIRETTFAGAADEYFTKTKKANIKGFLQYLKTEFGGG